MKQYDKLTQLIPSITWYRASPIQPSKVQTQYTNHTADKHWWRKPRWA